MMRLRDWCKHIIERMSSELNTATARFCSSMQSPKMMHSTSIKYRINIDHYHYHTLLIAPPPCNEPPWLRCYVVNIRLRTIRPVNPAYPVELKTLGDHLRKTRLDQELSQSNVASILQVNTDTVATWEMNRHKPTAKFTKSIISFLRFVPFTFEGQSLGRQLYYARHITGHTQKQAAELIGCDASNLRSIELDQRSPLTRTYEKIQNYIDSSLDS